MNNADLDIQNEGQRAVPRPSVRKTLEFNCGVEAALQEMRKYLGPMHRAIVEVEKLKQY